MSLRARLYDAKGHDREVDLRTGPSPSRRGTRLLWVDVDGGTPDEFALLVERLKLDPALGRHLAEPAEAARLIQFEEQIYLSLVTVDDEGAETAEATTHGRTRGLATRPLRFVASGDLLITVHDGPVGAIERIDSGTEGETRLGDLDAAEFLASIVDEVVVGYHRVVEGLESEIDRLDELALDRVPRDDVLARIVAMRRRVGEIRRTLAPQHAIFASLARPEMRLHTSIGRPWPGLLSRFERALDEVEHVRELLLGTYDIYMGRTAQRTNEVMKVLTILSAVLLPSVVLAGTMGMNFKVGFFDAADNFWVVVGAMAVLAGAILVVARRNDWL